MEASRKGGTPRAAESTQSPRLPSLLPGLQALQHQRCLGLGFLQEAGDAPAGLTDTGPGVSVPPAHVPPPGPGVSVPPPMSHPQAQTQASVSLPLQPTTYLPAQAPRQLPVPSGRAPWPILSGMTPSPRPGDSPTPHRPFSKDGRVPLSVLTREDHQAQAPPS